MRRPATLLTVTLCADGQPISGLEHRQSTARNGNGQHEYGGAGDPSCGPHLRASVYVGGRHYDGDVCISIRDCLLQAANEGRNIEGHSNNRILDHEFLAI